MAAGRQYYLDNLKVWLTILVIFHSAGQSGGVPYLAAAPDPGREESDISN